MDRLAKHFASRCRIPLAVFILMAADVFALLSATIISLMLRFDNLNLAQVYEQHLRGHQLSLAVTLLVYVGSLYAFRLYRYAWRFASLEILWGIICANSVGLVGLIVVQAMLDGRTFPRSVLIIFWMLSIVMVGAVRVLLRLANLGRSYGSSALRILPRDTSPKRVVIMGGGADGARLLAALREDLRRCYEVIGFLDDMPQKRGIYIRGVQVLGPLAHLYDLLNERAVDEVLIAIPDASGEEIRDYVMACRRKQVPVKIIPGVRDVLSGRAQARLEEISLEDLLRRPAMSVDVREIGSYLQGQRVLVTGAGGSIGSELCRQILALDPEMLVLLGHGENSIHKVHQELCSSHPELAERLRVAIGSVSDDVRMDQVLGAHRPHVVFHAAAHKHVPIMEDNVQEAVQNNVLGTRCIAEACGHYGVERMVLISTDKAVCPSSVMGATKWLCEQAGRVLAQTHAETTYVTVRFGNVLGSRGSVVPLLQQQILQGGPITVTHPEATRYFMTIPEAVQLVLQAGATGGSGELYLLDMGKPVKVLDLACDMIRLSGYEPERDIKIVFTGLRPGEKLHEQLIGDGESLAPGACPGLSAVRRPEYFTFAEFSSVLRRLQQLASGGTTEQLLEYLGEVVPAFAHQRLLPAAVPIDPHQAGAAL